MRATEFPTLGHGADLYREEAGLIKAVEITTWKLIKIDLDSGLPSPSKAHTQPAHDPVVVR
jgi:hypothetical protein